ncbi:MAG: methylated-DNA--[protein]-cysteine S-methyltransferase [Thermoanaerobaculia bacterium]|nr:methylated-DNA--[protein]-cysteine S-methyltransferase [Thermoanaerobaculia bacterium]
MPEAETGPETAAPPQPTPEIWRVLVPSPIGFLGIELEGSLIVQVVLAPIGRERKRFTPLADLKPADRSDQLDEVIGRFSEYLAGARKELGLPYDLRRYDLPPFDRRVLKETAKIRYGRTRTYQQIGANAGRPSSYRQVLAVLQANPLPLVVPCHRVVTSKSGVGSYIGGVKRKNWLLRMEQKHLPLL